MMPVRLALIVLLWFLLMYQTSAADGPATVAGSISVSPQEEFYVSLESNRSTGFQWQLARPVDEKVVTLVRTDYRMSSPGMPGAGGIEVWIFRAEGRGETEISLEYARPWEKGKPPARVALFTISVNP